MLHMSHYINQVQLSANPGSSVTLMHKETIFRIYIRHVYILFLCYGLFFIWETSKPNGRKHCWDLLCSSFNVKWDLQLSLLFTIFELWHIFKGFISYLIIFSWTVTVLLMKCNRGYENHCLVLTFKLKGDG
jgi:hypothetical protein